MDLFEGRLSCFLLLMSTWFLFFLEFCLIRVHVVFVMYFLLETSKRYLVHLGLCYILHNSKIIIYLWSVNFLWAIDLEATHKLSKVRAKTSCLWSYAVQVEIDYLYSYTTVKIINMASLGNNQALHYPTCPFWDDQSRKNQWTALY